MGSVPTWTAFSAFLRVLARHASHASFRLLCATESGNRLSKERSMPHMLCSTRTGVSVFQLSLRGDTPSSSTLRNKTSVWAGLPSAR
jgi:hypothetical protein